MSYEAEAGLLGCILLDNKLINEINITSEHFYDYSNKQLFGAMQNINKRMEPINGITLLDELGQNGLNMLGGISYIEQMKESVASIHGYKTYENIIIKNWKSRERRSILRNAIDSEVEIQTVISDLNKVDQVGTKEVFNLAEHLTNMYDLPTTKVPKGLSGIPSGFRDLDAMTDGFQDEDSIIFGARPSMGKTAFMLNIAINSGVKGVIPIIFSLEMSAESLIKRMLSAIGEIDGIKVRNPYNYFNDEDKTKWYNAIDILTKINLHIFDKPNQTVNEMRMKVREVKNQNPNKKILVMTDYLTLIQPSQTYNGNAHLQVSEISRDLKTLAKEFKCPNITLAQLSRSVESRANKRPVMSDLRESGSIEQDADIIGFLYRDEYYDQKSEKENILEVDIAKQRNGPTGTIDLLYRKEINKIDNLYR